MKGQSSGPALSVVFVDYDNIYLSLKRKNEEAARRFAKDAGGWLRGIETGRLITSSQGINLSGPRRILLNRCYGNPHPRRNPADNSTDMNSFPFVRHHFQRAGFEVVDCVATTSQMKNSADIKMVIEILDLLKHQTYFDEFIVLSGDADFTPVLHRLRAHARRTVIFTNDHTAKPYSVVSDGEVRESDLITMLMEGRTEIGANTPQVEQAQRPNPAQLEQLAAGIMTEVASTVRAAGQPVPLEALADRAVRVLGHDRTVGSNWAGTGSFRDLVARRLPQGLRMSDQPPYYVFDTSRQVAAAARDPRRLEAPDAARSAGIDPRMDTRPPAPRPVATAPAGYGAAAPRPAQAAAPQRPAAAPSGPAPQQRGAQESPAAIQQSIARIHAASQAPPLAPPDYRALFESMADEITANGLSGAPTLSNIALRTQQRGADVHPDYIRMVMEVVSEADPWFEQGVSPTLLAHRFRNYVIAQCRRAGMSLSATEMDLIEMWFTGGPVDQAGGSARSAEASQAPQSSVAQPQRAAPVQQQTDARSDRWWHLNDGAPSDGQAAGDGDDLPRIVRSRLRI